MEHALPDDALEPDSNPSLELLPAPDEEEPQAEEDEGDDAEPVGRPSLGAEPAITDDPLKLYVRAIGDGRLLTPVEERELARRKDLGDEAAKRKLIESNLRLVMSITSVTRALADQGRTIRLPVHVAEQVRRAMRARRQLAQKLNRDPSIDEIAKEGGFTPERVRELFELVEEPVSLETPVGDGESYYGDLIEDEKSAAPDTATADHMRAAELAEALERLNPRMRHVLARRFGLDGQKPQTLEEVGAGLGITRERVRQLETRALRELRTVAPGLQLYLQQ